MMASFGLLALALTIAPVQDVTDYDRFQLFSNCEPMNLLIFGFSDANKNEEEIGLTEERVQFAMESRLRSARLYTSDRSRPYLSVSVSVVSRAFSISLKYSKKMRGLAAGHTGLASAWDRRITGTHGKDAEYNRFKPVGAPRRVPDGVPAGERIRLLRKSSAADPVAFDIERCFTGDLGTLQLSFFRPMI